MGPERSLARLAFAKINLDLRVLGVRPDGYHELRTTFQSIALADALTFTAVAGPFRIVCDDPGCPVDSRNLVWRAAELLWKAGRRSGAPRDMVVTIAKRIPIQGGLGGGSSDAAAALVALSSLWRIRITRARLLSLAGVIGADVPYFLEGGTVRGQARGDHLSRLPDTPRRWVVLVVAGFGVSTAEAFGWWDTAVGRDGAVHGSQTAQERRGALTGRTSGDGQLGITNDLQRVVSRHHPIVARLVTALERQGADHASLSGSGSAVFGLFRHRADAERAARALRRTGARRVVFLTRTLTRQECRKLAAK
jgi:4-diphosphocytidyl-2-C-methyl-D-erythritol kinase